MHLIISGLAKYASALPELSVNRSWVYSELVRRHVNVVVEVQVQWLAPVTSVTIMKTPGVKAMKRATKPFRKEKSNAKAYSIYIYRLQKEGNSAISVPRSLSGETFQLVVAEAARLSKSNKRGTITRQEVHSAVALLRPKRNFGEEGA